MTNKTNTKKHVYSLDLVIPKGKTREVLLKESFTIGSDQSADLCITDFGLAPLHIKFRIQNSVLTLTLLGPDASVKLGKQELQQGKMYILDHKDKIFVEQVKFIVREELEQEKVDLPGLPDVERQEKTDPQVQPEDLDEDESEQERSISRIIHDYEMKKENTDIDLPHPPKATVPTRKRLFSKKKSSDKVAGPWVFLRFWGLLIDILITFSLGTYGFSLLGIEKNLFPFLSKVGPFLQSLLTELKLPIIQPYAEKLFSLIGKPHLLSFALLFILVRVIPALLLGETIPYFLMGVQERSGFLSKRLKALIRETIGIMTLPYILFDLPILIGKRSLKEVLSFSRLESKNTLGKIFGIFIITPLFCFFLIAAPLILEMDSLKEDVLYLQTLNQKVERPIDNDVLLKARSTYWDIKLNVYHPKAWSFLPKVTKANKNENNKWLISLEVIDSENEQVNKLSKNEEHNYQDQLAKFTWLDPFFPFHSSALSKWTNQQSWTPMHSMEWKEIIDDSVKLSFLNTPNFILSRGPFFFPYLKLKKDILNILNVQNFSNLKSIKLGGSTGFQMSREDLGDVVWLIFKHGKFDLWTSQTKGKKKVLQEKVIRTLLTKAKRISKDDQNQDDNLPWNTFNTIDTFHLISKGEQIDSLDSKLLINHLIKLSKDSIDQDNSFLQKRLSMALKSYDKWLLNIGKDNLNKKNIESLRLSLNRLQKALLSKEEAFFKANLTMPQVDDQQNQGEIQ